MATTSKKPIEFPWEQFLAFTYENGLGSKLFSLFAEFEGIYEEKKGIDSFYMSEVMYALRRIANYQGISQRKVLENLILSTDKEILQSLKPGTQEWNIYYDV